jgi:GDP/UDP-N,N'-diacetylbacillosamine 2-epimerase (hydrolysing)
MINLHTRKICFLTGTRAEYGLLSGLIKKVESNKNSSSQLIVTGTHLSREHGNTINSIIKDKIKISKKIDISLTRNTKLGVSKSLSIAVEKISRNLNNLKPDLLVLLGDRYETFAAAISATILNIPIAHIHGGETTQGAFDESFRHSITKMSHFHFCTTNAYKKRIIQLGENPKNVFCVGALGIDNILSNRYLNKKQLEREFSLPLSKKNIFITFHPVTLEKDSSLEQFKNLLKSLGKLEEVSLFFSKANADPGGKKINDEIERFVKKNKSISFVRPSYGQNLYFSLLKYMDLVIGNSSSGVIEVPHFNIPTINIGDRQKGRIMGKSVINCLPLEKSIDDALKKAFSNSFLSNLTKFKNPYGNGGAIEKISKKIFSLDLDNILKKSFYDL